MAAFNAVVGILRTLLTLDSSQYKSGLRSSADELKKFSRDMRSVTAQTQAVGSALTRQLTLPLVGVGALVGKVAADFESSFAGVRKTVDATEPEFAAMALQFRGLAKEIPVNVNELNRLGEAAGALGIPKAEIVEFAKVMAMLGVTTNLTSDQAAEGIAKIQNIFGAAGQNTQEFASTLVALGNAGASTESQILEMATRIAGAGNAVGMTQAQVLGFASALSSVGIEAEMGGSAISRVFINIAEAVRTGGDAVKGFAQTAGMDIETFSNRFREDAAGAVSEFISGLGRMKDTGGDLLGTLDALGFTEIRVRDTLLRAAGAGNLLAESLRLAGVEWEKNSALTEEARKRFETTYSQLILLWNGVKDLGITLGNALLPAIKTVAEALRDMMPTLERMAEGFANLPGPVQAVGVGFLAALAAAGPAILIFNQIAQTVTYLAAAFGTGGAGLKALTALFEWGAPVISGFSRALTVLTGPMGWIVGSGAAILTVTNTWGEFFRIVKAGGEILLSVARLIGEAIVWVDRFIENVVAKVARAVDAMLGITNKLKGIRDTVKSWMGGAAETMEGISATLNSKAAGSAKKAEDGLAGFRKELQDRALPAIRVADPALKAFGFQLQETNRAGISGPMPAGSPAVSATSGRAALIPAPGRSAPSASRASRRSPRSGT